MVRRMCRSTTQRLAFPIAESRLPAVFRPQFAPDGKAADARLAFIMGKKLITPAGPLGLADAYLKTSRAKEHLESLRQELQVFYESKPCRFFREDDFENQRHIVRMTVTSTPDRISLIAGDFLFNLRAALDQLIWYLVKVTVPYPRDTQFPILERPMLALSDGAQKACPHKQRPS
jgi:hypothetical protein